MAGITGIILKRPANDLEKLTLHKSLIHMMDKLVYYPEQISNTYYNANVFIGNAVPVSSVKNDHYIRNKSLPYHIIVDGMVFIDNRHKRVLETKYNTEPLYNDYYYLPFLFDQYQSDFIHHLTGWFNIFIHNEKTNKNLLINDRLGYLPLYYYDDKDYFIFSSKIESILASGLLNKIEFDEVTIAEHLFFNYPLSDLTYIKGIYTLPDASVLNFDNSEYIIERYWDIDELFEIPALNKKRSLEAIDNGIESSLAKFFQRTTGKINFSLTGGWDSRVILSYLLPDKKQILNTYSFGAPGADDIIIPKQIAANEGFKYTPYQLDQNYLDQEFLRNAEDTIKLSNGTRNYKRAHYVYAITQVAKLSDTLLTGIFGDEVFKVGKSQGGDVISGNAIKFIDSGFNVDRVVQDIGESELQEFFNVDKKNFVENFEIRLHKISQRFKKFETKGEQYFAFRFTLNLRKYFGNEVNSYNDFVYCFSPFIDYNFLKQFARTKYMVSRYDFKRTSLKLKAQSSWLYYKLTKLSYPALTKYHSTRGFSMKDTRTLYGITKIFFNKTLKKKLQKQIPDGFNTKDTGQIFHSMLIETKMVKKHPVFIIDRFEPAQDDLHSLLYWTATIMNNYIQ